jgi:hypothetical protein
MVSNDRKRAEVHRAAREVIDDVASREEVERVFRDVVAKSKAAAMQHIRELAEISGFTRRLGADRVERIIIDHFGGRPN